MKEHRKQYAAAATIAAGLYLVCNFLTSFIHVLMAYAAGYSTYADYIEYSSSSGAVVGVLLLGATSHILFAWITVKVITKYALRRGCFEKGMFDAASLSVILFALFLFPILFGSSPGWLTYLTHSIALEAFGKKALKKAPIASNPPEELPHMGFESSNRSRFCRICGEPLSEGSNFCHKCGTKI